MKPKDLLTVWDAPDHTRLATNQYSFRPPIRVAAKMLALCDLFPKKNRSEIISDLLATALDDIEESLSYEEGSKIRGHDEQGKPIYECFGPRIRFRELTEKYTDELEAELTKSGPRQTQATNAKGKMHVPRKRKRKP